MDEELEIINLSPDDKDIEYGNHRLHLLVGYKNGKPSNDPPFDELRLIENVGTDEEIKYKGKL